jgi:hypothetical protein
MTKGSSEEEARWKHGTMVDLSKDTVDLYPTKATSSDSGSKIKEIILKDVAKVRTIDACSVDVKGGGVPLLESRETSSLFAVHYKDRVTGNIDRCERLDSSFGYAMAASTTGRVVAVGGWRTFINEFLDDRACDNKHLCLNILHWLCNSNSES